MKIEKNRVVSFHYRLSEQGGAELENSYNGEPSLYLHGARNILPALEKALAGLGVGDSTTVDLSAAQAYGERQEGRVQRIPAKYLKHEGKMKPGQIVRFRDDKGIQQATVIKVGKFSVDVDTNHPLAGKSLSFAIEIVDIREASAEEIAHGHAHGPGGHQH
ncbi:FKBP-type peptidyl-prolyl cis-trans isomerase SlyD [Litorivivens lipolytica]|uniref:Peptidyl-prolyl cis-trans isomerase n=1 Tax=Litorivivens lipolytica TaxID=1524264 RepID=A0A7W4W6X0_9GAMM|nr:peptidylprolyl isomerase [Litorivivens lipolytica]MBB3048549.1 FKBP-type peptidyl-prolyl cis-trans isomerase SlyD [Litorivivens lipolytica]